MAENIGRKVCIFDVDYSYEDERTAVRLWGISDQGEIVTAIDNNFYPYMYVEVREEWKSMTRTKDVMRMIRELNNLGSNAIKKVEPVRRKYLGNETDFIKITLMKPADVVWLWDIVKKWPSIKNQYEYSVPFRKRYIIDNEIPIMEWITINGEKSSAKGLRTDVVIKNPEITRSREENLPKMNMLALDIKSVSGEIVLITLIGENGFRKVLTHSTDIVRSDEFSVEVMDTEKDMIERMASVIIERNPAVLLTFNGDKMAIDTLYKRAKKLGTNLDIGRDGKGFSFYIKGKSRTAMACGMVHIDIFNFINSSYGRYMDIETASLNNISKKLLGKKVDTLDRWETEVIWNTRKDIIRLMSYHIRETEAIMELGEKIYPKIAEYANICRQTLFDVSRMRPAQMIDWILVREAHRLNEMVLNQPTKEEMNRRYSVEPYEGGYAMEVVQGIHDNITIAEFRNLYPSIVIEHNISPETVDSGPEHYAKTNAVPESEHYFNKDETGFVPMVVKHSLEEKKKTLKIMEYMNKSDPQYNELECRVEALTTLANSVYGYFAYPGSRWYSRLCASSIASWGRYYMAKVINKAREEGFKIINADSYSVFFKETNEKKVSKLIEKCNDFLPKDSQFTIRGSYKKGLFLSVPGSGKVQKKRYAMLSEDNKLIIRGFEAVRRDWSKIAKETQEMVLMSILRDGSPKKAAEIIVNSIEKLKNGDVDLDDLIIKNQLTKPLNSYEQNWPHVSAAKKLIDRGVNITVGSVISYIISSGPGTVSERAEPYGYTNNYDPSYYINNQILSSVSGIMKAANYPINELQKAIQDGSDQTSLQSFLKKSFRDRLKEKLGV